MDNFTDCLHQLRIYTNVSAYRTVVVIFRVSPPNRSKLAARIDGASSARRASSSRAWLLKNANYNTDVSLAFCRRSVSKMERDSSSGLRNGERFVSGRVKSKLLAFNSSRADLRGLFSCRQRYWHHGGQKVSWTHEAQPPNWPIGLRHYCQSR